MNLPRALRAILDLTGLGLAALMLNCGGGGSTPAPAPAPIPDPVATSLVPSDAAPAFGATFTLTATYSAGTGAIDNGVVCPATGVATAPIAVNWSGARTYTLTVTNSAGTKKTTTAVVTPQTVAVGAISPANVTQTVGTTVTFTPPTVTGGALNTFTWSAVLAGTSTAAGSWAGNVWTAPAAPGSVTITATSVDDPTKSASTTVTVVAVPAPVATSLVALPDIQPAYGATFTLKPTYSGGTGTIDHGVTCPATTVASAPITANWSGARTYTLTVTNAATPPVTATQSVIVTPQTVSVGAISPANVTRTVNATVTFTPPTVSGGALNTFTWSAVLAGTSTAAGSWAGNVWTAPAAPGSVTIKATSVDDPTKSATTTVTVVAVPAPVATSLVASTQTPAYGATFTLTPTYSAGTGTIDHGVTCPATNVASAPVTANWGGGVARTFTLTVTNAATPPVSATTSVIVTPQTVSVGAITPANATRTVGTTVTFTPPTVTGGALNTFTWSADIGSFVGDVWTAPGTAGTATITATSVDDPSKTSTTTVTVVDAPVAASLVASTQTPAFGTTFTLTPNYAGTGSIDHNVTCPANGVASAAITANWIGARTFTLSVTNAAGATPVTQTVIITPGAPGLGTFTALTGAMTSVRKLSSATLLENGTVLIAGGADGSDAVVNTAEVFTYTGGTTGAFVATASPFTVARKYHTATLLPGGTDVILTGGENSAVVATSGYLDSTERYSAGSFVAGAMTTPRSEHTASLLGNGKVLIAGGRDAAIKDAELYDPADQSFTALSGIHGMKMPRASHVATELQDGNVLITGGYNGPVLATAEYYDRVANTFTYTAAPMSTPRWGHTATRLDDGKVLVLGGLDGYEVSGTILNTAELYDPATKTFSALPNMTAARWWHVAVKLGDGRVLIIGGQNGNPLSPTQLSSAEIYDPIANTFTATGNAMPTAREWFTATVLADGVHVLVTGGSGNTTALIFHE